MVLNKVKMLENRIRTMQTQVIKDKRKFSFDFDFILAK